jgi:sulfite oxidase
MEEVRKHTGGDRGVWVVYKGGVYDVSEFISSHPGGTDKIMMAAGGSVEPFWAMYKQHQAREVQEILANYRIGALKAEDIAQQVFKDPKDPFAHEKPRHPALVVRLKQPFNAETPVSLIPDNYITSNELFFVRNHLPIPVFDPETYRLKVLVDKRVQGQENIKQISITVDELKKFFPRHSVVATIQCAGNRRSEMNVFKPVQGTNWSVGAISTAVWSGARLRDVLYAVGYDEDKNDKILHVQFEGLDKDMSGTPYGASISIQKAMERSEDVLLAYEMNGEPIPTDHGFPVRVVVPGIVGARSVKWVENIILSDRESSSHWQQKDYKCFNSSTECDQADYSKAKSIQESPVQSAICDPIDGSKIPFDTETVEVKGYAFSGGGREIIRVDVSLDEGKTWHVAELLPRTVSFNSRKDWAWTLWKASLPITEKHRASGTLQITCKAVDGSYNEQPASFAHNWNFRGLLANAWHSIRTKIAEEDE